MPDLVRVATAAWMSVPPITAEMQRPKTGTSLVALGLKEDDRAVRAPDDTPVPH